MFATVRDATGAAQFVVHEATCPGVGDLLHELPKESVIAVSGVVRPRPSEMVNSVGIVHPMTPVPVPRPCRPLVWCHR